MDEVFGWRVRERTAHACEYCRMSQAHYATVPFPIDHIIARQHGGRTTLGNLALSCLHDNFHKGPNIAGIDPVTRKWTLNTPYWIGDGYLYTILFRGCCR
jgi:HNH endonuclease